jgi:hypothetical protein
MGSYQPDTRSDHVDWFLESHKTPKLVLDITMNRICGLAAVRLGALINDFGIRIFKSPSQI